MLGTTLATAMEMPPMSEKEAMAAAADYQNYCALCHGQDRQGYANDDAPSLRSESLFISGYPNHIMLTVSYGRRGTPMGAYAQEAGGPLDQRSLRRLVTWLGDQVDVEPDEQFPSVVEGDIALGEHVFAQECAVCHGDNGGGEIAPAIGNPAMLSVTTDNFIRYAIENGRDGSDMPAFGEILEPEEINAVTAFLRSKAGGWNTEAPILRAPPGRDQWVLNPEAAAPGFELKDELYVKAADLNQALQENRRLVLLDPRVTSMWQMAHIEGSVPIPYYFDDFENLARDLPSDGTWIVTYCECPRAAAESVDRKLRAQGLKNTAVLWEGIQGWVSLGYPVAVGQVPAEQPDP
jgi:mono/diheme cytochrome c family protein/rhodanese-related sulfurtransferase